jgi:hypothetical protein
LLCWLLSSSYGCCTKFQALRPPAGQVGRCGCSTSRSSAARNRQDLSLETQPLGALSRDGGFNSAQRSATRPRPFHSWPEINSHSRAQFPDVFSSAPGWEGQRPGAGLPEPLIFRAVGRGNARRPALRQECAGLRQSDASKFWREKLCIWVPVVASKGQSGEEVRQV